MTIGIDPVSVPAYQRAMPTVMTKPKRQTSVHAFDTETRRADAIMAAMTGAPRWTGVRLTRTTVLRMAMLRGLDLLEREHRMVEDARSAAGQRCE